MTTNLVNDKIVATATVVANGTSVFSAEATVAAPTAVTNTYSSGAGTLNAAISFADNHSGSTITFALPTTDPGYNSGTGTWTIKLSGALPSISVQTTIDGTTQTGYSPNDVPLIAINANGVAGDGLDLALHSNNSKILGLDIFGFTTGAGIHIQSNGDLIAGDYLGTNVTGTAAGPGNLEGVLIDGTAGNNTIGGLTAATGNVISFEHRCGRVARRHVVGGQSGRWQLHRNQCQRYQSGRRSRRRDLQLWQHDRRK